MLVIAVRKPPHFILEVDNGNVADLERKGYTTVCIHDTPPPHRQPAGRWIIKRWNRQEQRMLFWQVPWCRRAEDGVIHQTGGWINASRYATKYATPEYAQRVNLIRFLEGDVDEVRERV
jgi:hypothetical protein